jgi:urocanate hydratase
MSNTPFCEAIKNAWDGDFERFSKREAENQERDKFKCVMRNSLQRHMAFTLDIRKEDGFSRMEKCRYALRVLDNCGWKRSFHQREFHEVFYCCLFAHGPVPKFELCQYAQNNLDFTPFDLICLVICANNHVYFAGVHQGCGEGVFQDRPGRIFYASTPAVVTNQ